MDEKRNGITEYPRVLIVYMTCIHKADQHGLLLRNLFTEWPTENLAQIFSGGDGYGETFCGKTFKLGPPERRFGHLFFRIKHSKFGQSTKPIILEKSRSQFTLQKVKRTAILKNKFSSFFLSTGVWELIFSPQLSVQLVKWVEDFDPQVIYCQGYDLSFCWLPIMLSERFNIPVVFHTTDDWPNNLYKHFPFMHRLVLRTTKKLVHLASARIAFSQRMAEGYQKQFGEPFDIVMNCDNFDRFTAAAPARTTEDDVISVVYTGALYYGRWQSIVDLCDAATMLSHKGVQVKITAFTSSLPVEAANVLRNKPNLQVLPPLEHDQIPKFLKGADILFLPETFDPKIANEIRFSISSKAQLYMMSGRPILVYGSPISGIVDYAKREGWAYVVDQPRPELLVNALHRLSTDRTLSSHLIETGIQVALRNHEERKVREHFVTILQKQAED